MGDMGRSSTGETSMNKLSLKKAIVKSVMEAQITIVKKHASVGATCFIGLDKSDNKSVILVPCIEAPEQLTHLAKALRESSDKLFALAESAKPRTNESVH